MITTLNLSYRNCWDIAGVDGLRVAQLLFNDRVNQIAPFQSLETTIEINSDSISCSVLRLCEGNFRVVTQPVGQRTNSQPSSQDAISLYFSALEQIWQQMQTQHRVWIKQFDWLSAIVIPESVGLALLPRIATTKPPYRLQGMAIDRAAPARIDGISVLIWRHFVSGQPAFELHIATKALETVKTCLEL